MICTKEKTKRGVSHAQVLHNTMQLQKRYHYHVGIFTHYTALWETKSKRWTCYNATWLIVQFCKRRDHRKTKKKMHPCFTLRKGIDKWRHNMTTLHSLHYVSSAMKCGHLVLRVGHEHVTTGALFFFFFFTLTIFGGGVDTTNCEQVPWVFQQWKILSKPRAGRFRNFRSVDFYRHSGVRAATKPRRQFLSQNKHATTWPVRLQQRIGARQLV